MNQLQCLAHVHTALLLCCCLLHCMRRLCDCSTCLLAPKLGPVIMLPTLAQAGLEHTK